MSTIDWSNNPPKMLVVLVSLACITILLITGSIEGEAGVGLLGLIVGYGVGNGIAAKKDQPVEPIIGHREPQRRATDMPQHNTEEGEPS